MKALLNDFKVKTYEDLNFEGAFRMMLLNICKHRNENYRYWKPTKYGFIIITHQSLLKFKWINKDYICFSEAKIY